VRKKGTSAASSTADAVPKVGMFQGI